MTAHARDEAVSIIPIHGLPEMTPGDDLGAILTEAIREDLGELLDGDIVVVTHKIVSKAEGQLVDLKTVTPGEFASRWAEDWNKDARQVEVVMQQAKRIVRMHHGLIIAETQHGFICANAGVDASNSGGDQVVLLPVNPDQSAETLRGRFVDEFAGDNNTFRLGVIITDSFGRPWRNGIVNIAIGASGISPFADYRGQHDPSGYELRASVLSIADELAGAAELVMHKTHRVPVALIRNYEWHNQIGNAAELVMPDERNLFK